VSAQNDTLTGVLYNAKNKVVRNYPVTLGKLAPVTVKTSRNGVFIIPEANLKDTLYIRIPGGKMEFQIPVSEYNYLTVRLMKSNYEINHYQEPDVALLKILNRERNKMISSSTMNKDEIEKSRCQDILCLLRRMSGVSIQGSSIQIRGVGSINSSNDALIVLDGIPMNDLSVLSSIHPRNLEEISILKEGSQYGAMGANGVIIIKTAKDS
jgi:outer membrane receptor for ferrienterochelin and colicin